MSPPHLPSFSCFCFADVLPGYRGHLVSESFLERQIDRQPVVSGDRNPSSPGIHTWLGIRRELGPASALRAMFERGAAPVLAALGFDNAAPLSAPAESLFGLARGPNAAIGVLVTPWGERLDRFWRAGVVQARACGADWCVLFNGTHLRVVHCGRVYSRRYAEFDLELALSQDRPTAALSTLMSARALAATASDGQPSIAMLAHQSEAHATAVCGSLRAGVLDASQSVLTALVCRRRSLPPLADAFEQALTLVYRILFLLFAEARALVPLWHPVYRESYSLESLRDAAAGGNASGLWDALRAVNHLAHAGCSAGDLRVTAFNGRLFAPARTPLVERRDLDDEAARSALVALTTRASPDREGREPISYRDLGVEQLGAVYETLLDYEPQVEPKPTGRSSGPTVSLRPGSGVRKSTGTFYTPQPLAHYLVSQSLGPLVRNASPDQILSLKVLDPSAGSGAFLVAACSYLAEAYESALVKWTGVYPSDIGDDDRARFRRTVAERCLYGVDINPMAVQLARLSLWLSTLAADRPLSFLDHHLVHGDSLLGTWLAALRRSPAAHRASARPGLPLFDEEAAMEAVRGALPARFSLALEPNDTAEQVRTKERTLKAMSQRDTALSKWKRVADLWCAGWFAATGECPAALFATLADAILTGRSALPEATTARYLESAEALAAGPRFFHWELEFPEVFFGQNGERLAAAGFDAVIGNPPWDMIRADSGGADRRARSRVDAASLVRFTRDSGVYSAQSGGQANRYQLFLERAVALTRPGGRIGLVMPWGLLSDHGSARLRRLMFSQCAVDALVGLDNRRGVFPIHRSVRFVLLTASRGDATADIRCRLGEDDPAILDTAGDGDRPGDGWFTVKMSPALLERLSGDGLDVPLCKGPRDLSIVERAATLFAPLGSAAGWDVRFGRELNASDHREHLRSTGPGVPVVEGKQLEPFRADLAAARYRMLPRDARVLLGTQHEHARLAYRDVASATNRLTLIAALLPAGCVSTHTVFCLRTPLAPRAQHFLCGLFNSLVLNYLVRLRVNTHVTTAIVERLPVPTADQAGAAYSEVATIARALARRPDGGLQARLNGLIARLYQLTEDDFAHILGTFPLVPESERDAALGALRAMNSYGANGNRRVWPR